LETKTVVLNELSHILIDQKILNKQRDNLEERIILKLYSLGVKGSNYSELVIKMSGIQDKYSKTFIEIESLIERRSIIVKELTMIEETIKTINDKMKKSKLIEYEVFSLRYFDGLTLQEIANKKKYSIDRIKQINASINKKFECQ